MCLCQAVYSRVPVLVNSLEPRLRPFKHACNQERCFYLLAATSLLHCREENQPCERWGSPGWYWRQMYCKKPGGEKKVHRCPSCPRLSSASTAIASACFRGRKRPSQWCPVAVLSTCWSPFPPSFSSSLDALKFSSLSCSCDSRAKSNSSLKIYLFISARMNL